jgi:hypothetical protein
MSFLQRIRRIDIEDVWACGTIVSGFCGSNYLVYNGIKRREKTVYIDVIVDSIGGFMIGSVVGFFSPVIISAGVFSIPGYIAGKINLKNT